MSASQVVSREGGRCTSARTVQVELKRSRYSSAQGSNSFAYGFLNLAGTATESEPEREPVGFGTEPEQEPSQNQNREPIVVRPIGLPMPRICMSTENKRAQNKIVFQCVCLYYIIPQACGEVADLKNACVRCRGTMHVSAREPLHGRPCPCVLQCRTKKS